MKTIFLLADGMGGWPIESLGGRTTLEAARTPNMDKLAEKAILGRVKTVPDGLPPGSDIANMSLLGFDPASLHTGRGPIEAAAQGLKLDPKDLVYRMNLVDLSELTPEGIMNDYSSGHLRTEDSIPLVNKLQAELGGKEFDFYPGIQYRHLLVQKGGANEPEAKLDIRPPHDITGQGIGPDITTFSSSPRLWDMVQKAAAILARDDNRTKARSIWPWGQGRPMILPDFKGLFGVRGAVISAVDVIKGIGKAANMDVLEVDGVTGLLDTNYAGKVEAALSFLDQGDFAFVHVEAPDECGHSGIVEDKIESIERFDRLVAGPVMAAAKDKDMAIIIACDHFTPIATMTHSPDPVPFLLNLGDGEQTGAEVFTEKTTGDAGLVFETGHEFLPWALKTVAQKG